MVPRSVQAGERANVEASELTGRLEKGPRSPNEYPTKYFEGEMDVRFQGRKNHPFVSTASTKTHPFPTGRLSRRSPVIFITLVS